MNDIDHFKFFILCSDDVDLILFILSRRTQ
jgi:hypothetical protein